MWSTRAKQARGFTLIELLVVIAVIALLIGILLPALGKARSQGQSAKCQGHMRQYGTAHQIYITDYDVMPGLAKAWTRPTSRAMRSTWKATSIWTASRKGAPWWKAVVARARMKKAAAPAAPTPSSRRRSWRLVAAPKVAAPKVAAKRLRSRKAAAVALRRPKGAARPRRRPKVAAMFGEEVSRVVRVGILA
jgi:prepilin-type N-terminal cleavage/methylation domain-containing protein